MKTASNFRHHLRLAAMFLMLFALQLQAPAQITFSHDQPWQELLSQARQENKLVFLDCFATWCGPCRWMAANAFVDPEVSAFFNEHFINAKIDMEQGEGPELSTKFGIEAYPTLLFVNADGEVVKTSVGALDAEKLLALGKTVAPENTVPVEVGRPTPDGSATNTTTLADMKQRYANGNRDRHFVAEYILALKAAGENYNEPLARFKPGMVGSALLYPDNWNVFHAIFTRTDTEQARYFLSHLSDFGAAYGTELVNSKALVMYKAPLIKAGQDRNATAYAQARTAMLQSGIPRVEYAVLDAEQQVCQEQQDWLRYAQIARDFVALHPDADAGTLNNLAWGFYLHVTDVQQLKQAMKWAHIACEDQPNYANLDTKAMLLKKLGRTQEAIVYAELAIEAAKLTGEDYSATEYALSDLLEY